MTHKELKHLNRRELLELLISQMEENERLRENLENAQKALSNRQITINKAGSIADAAMQLNGVFDAAQDAAMQYMENIRRLGREQEAVCQKMEVDARKRAEDICTAANVYSRNVHLKADAYRKQVLKSLKVLLQDQEGLMKTVMKDGKEGHS